MKTVTLAMLYSLLQTSAQVFIRAIIQKSTPQDDHYIAAVVEYEVQRDEDINVQSYLRIITEASEQNADIIVFPELTLTQGNRSISVPIFDILQEHPVPAHRPDLYDKILVSMSEAARINEIYVVINVQEELDCNNAKGEYCPQNKTYLFNTNVVFDRNGAVIDRYRKLNLFGEFTRTPALKPQLGIFDTDFGVTFGHYICFDLKFQIPAVQMVEKYNVTNIIFPVMWYSELPYLTAVQIQEAYSYAMNVNFLAAGANNARVGSAGSGIYSGKAGALISIMPGLPTTRLLVAKVPKVPGMVSEPYPGPVYGSPSDLDDLYLMVDPSLPSHVSKTLVQGLQEFSLVDKEVSCRFRIKLNEGIGEMHYNYRAVAFSGVRTYSGLATGGTTSCAVIACTGESIHTCGTRFPKFGPNSTAVFEELSIAASVSTPEMDPGVDAHNSVFFPVSLTTSVMPLQPKDYDYQINEQGNITVLTLTLKNYGLELYSFAVWGRVFDRDGQEATPPLACNPGSSYNLPYISSLIIVIISLLIIMF